MISVVMPVYFINDELIQLTRDALFSIKGQWDELIMVDDCSPIKTSEFKPLVSKYLVNDTNLSYIGAANRGINEAKNEYVVLMCNDTRLVEGKLIDLCREGYTFPTFQGKASPFWDGAFYAFPKQLGGLYDKRYKTYFGDLDKFYQAKQDKVRLEKVDEVIAWHKQSATTSKVGRNSMYDEDYIKFKNKWGFDPIPKYNDLL